MFYAYKLMFKGVFIVYTVYTLKFKTYLKKKPFFLSFAYIESRTNRMLGILNGLLKLYLKAFYNCILTKFN